MGFLLRRLALAGLLALVLVEVSEAATLVMVDWRACPHCQRFHREIGNNYANTSLGRIAPLRKVSVFKKWPSDLRAIAPVRTTPIFILVDNNGREVGRIRGYGGRDHFLARLNSLVARLK